MQENQLNSEYFISSSETSHSKTTQTTQDARQNSLSTENVISIDKSSHRNEDIDLSSESCHSLTRDATKERSNLSNPSLIKKRKRGATKMGVKYVGPPKPVQVEFNERGQAIGENSAKLASTYSVIAREHVPIVISNWGKVSDEKKNEIWELVTQKFPMDDTHKEWILGKMAASWRQHKSKITTAIRKANKSKNRFRLFSKIRPSNVILDEDWVAFIKERISPEFDAKSKKFSAMRKKQNLPHTMSRKGYARLEHEMKAESSEPRKITRADVWTRGHLKKNGEPGNDLIGQKLEEIKQLTQSNTNPLPNNIKEDVIAQVLGKERRGRVRGLGFGVTPTQLVAQCLYNQKIKELEEKFEAKMKKFEEMFEVATSKLNHSEQIKKNLYDDLPATHTNASKSQKVSGTVEDNLPNENARCQLLHWYNFDVEEVVAEGRIASTDPRNSVHHMPLGRDCWKVWIEDIIDSNVNLFRTTSEFRILSDAIGSTIAWPKSCIKIIN